MVIDRYEEAKPYERYRKRKKTLGNLVGGFIAIIIGTALITKTK
jgi:hypothetical protein